MQTQETTANLKYTKSRIIKGGEELITVNIRLNDCCNNGHEDFAITADITTIRGRWLSGGCQHAEILKYFPRLKPFVDLHLCDMNGAPMGAAANMAFHLTHKGEIWPREAFCQYYNIDPAHYDMLQLAAIAGGSRANYIVMRCEIQRLGIPERWKIAADAAILQLEEMTGQKFKSAATKSNYQPPTDEEYAQYLADRAAGKFTADNIMAEELRRKNEARAKAILDVIAVADQEKETAENIARLKIALLNLYLDPMVAILYSHTNEIRFNWCDGAKATEEEIKRFVAYYETGATKLPEGLTIKYK